MVYVTNPIRKILQKLSRGWGAGSGSGEESIAPAAPETNLLGLFICFPNCYQLIWVSLSLQSLPGLQCTGASFQPRTTLAVISSSRVEGAIEQKGTCRTSETPAMGNKSAPT